MPPRKGRPAVVPDARPDDDVVIGARTGEYITPDVRPDDDVVIGVRTGEYLTPEDRPDDDVEIGARTAEYLAPEPSAPAADAGRRPAGSQQPAAGGRRTRLPVTKTPKVYVGGEFIRSESGRTYPISADGKFFANIPQCTRKDVRNAVEKAAAAGSGWAKRTPYNRGQIVYRLAEMLEARSAEMAEAIVRTADCGEGEANAEVTAAVDRLIYYAGWADKYEQVLGNTNPVGGPFFNFTVCEPVGIVGVITDDRSPFLALISQVAPALVSGNVVVAVASERYPYPAIVLGEMLATSDLPAGVLNILTGYRKELVPTFATHTHIRGIEAVVTPEERKELALGAAESVKRLHARANDKPLDWADDAQQSVYEVRNFVEFKTVWHPIGA